MISPETASNLLWIWWSIHDATVALDFSSRLLFPPAQPVDLRGPRTRHAAADRRRSPAAALHDIAVTLRRDGSSNPPATGRSPRERPRRVRHHRARRLPARPNEHGDSRSLGPTVSSTEDNRVVVTPDTSLFPPDRLVEHARHLGAAHRVERQPRGRGRGLLARLDAAAERLEAVYRGAERQPRRRAPAVRRLDPRQLLRRRRPGSPGADRPAAALLPRTAATGRRARTPGYPRVYALATELIAHSDNRVDVDVLRTFVPAYQETHPLRIGEIWAIPIMLRMALVERLCALADDVLRGRHDRARAQEIVDAAGTTGSGQARTPVALALGDRVARAVHAAVCRRAAARPARSPAVDGAGLGATARAAAGARRRRRDDPAGGAAGSVDAGVHWQRHHQHADAVGAGLADLRRARQPRRASACATTRRARTRGWTLPRAIAIGSRSSNSREAHDTRRSRSPSGPAPGPPAPGTTRPAAERQHHVGYYLISRGRFELEVGPAVPRAQARAVRPVRVPAPGPGVSRRRSRS